MLIRLIDKAPNRADFELLQRGYLLDEGAVERLGQAVRDDPGFRDARLMLMGAVRAPAELRAEQVIWFAEHEPKTFLGSHYRMAARGEHYERAKLHWLDAAQTHFRDPDVVENAAWFMLYLEPDRGGELLERRADTETAPDWALRAAIYFAVASDTHQDRCATFAARALNAGFRMFRLDAALGSSSLDFLYVMRSCAKRAGMDLADRPLMLAEGVRSSLKFAGPDGAPQLRHVIRGFVALAAGEIGEAERHLHEGTALEGLPTEELVSLAGELAGLGAKDAVLSALHTWEQRFLESAGAARMWAEALRMNMSPSPPRFPPKK